MFKMISAELYKLRKSKSFWIMLSVVAGVAIFASVVFGVVSGEEVAGIRPDSASVMFMIGLPFHVSTILFILVGFTVVFINSDFDSGTIRNPLSVGISRGNYFLSKIVTILITCFAFATVVVLASGLPYLLFESWGDAFNLPNFLASFGLGYLILVSQATLFTAIASVTRKVGATLGIVLGYLVFDMMASAFIGLLEIDGIVRSVANILPSPAGAYLEDLSMGTASFGNVMIVVAVSVGLIVIASALAVGSLVKKDI